MKWEYDPEADAGHVNLGRRRTSHHCEQLDDSRIIDYAEDGTVVGVELLYVSDGVVIDGLPEQNEVERVLRAHDVKVLTKAG